MSGNQGAGRTYLQEVTELTEDLMPGLLGDPQPVPATPTTMYVSPGTAAMWLTTNTHNRHLRRTVVAAYVEDMRAGRWMFTGEPVKFSRDGTLLDGQHRLAAIVQYGSPILMHVMPGLQMKSQDAMDAGPRRMTSDALALQGEKNASLLAATARFLIRWQQGNLTSRRDVQRLSTGAVLDWLALPEHQSVRAAVNDIGAHKSDYPCIRPSIAASVLWRLQRIDHDAATELFADIRKVRSYGEGDPRSALYQRLTRASQSREMVSDFDQVFLLIQVWNAIRVGRPVKKLAISRGGPMPEPRD